MGQLYRRRPVVVRAAQWFQPGDAPSWAMAIEHRDHAVIPDGCRVNVSDWLVVGEQGVLSCIENDKFRRDFSPTVGIDKQLVAEPPVQKIITMVDELREYLPLQFFGEDVITLHEWDEHDEPVLFLRAKHRGDGTKWAELITLSVNSIAEVLLAYEGQRAVLEILDRELPNPFSLADAVRVRETMKSINSSMEMLSRTDAGKSAVFKKAQALLSVMESVFELGAKVAEALIKPITEGELILAEEKVEQLKSDGSVHWRDRMLSSAIMTHRVNEAMLRG